MILYMAAGENCNFSGNADTEKGEIVVVFNPNVGALGEP